MESVVAILALAFIVWSVLQLVKSDATRVFVLVCGIIIAVYITGWTWTHIAHR